MRRFFIPSEHIGPDQAVLTGDQAHHARTVMRLSRGDRVVVFDGRGHEYEARIAALDSRQITLDRIRSLPGCQESGLQLILAQGYLKDKKMDRMVRQLTELGVTRWIPFFARRSVALPDAQRRLRRHQRWEKMSLEALKQCRRSRPMRIDQVTSFDEVLSLSGCCEQKWVFYENSEQPVDWIGQREQKPNSLFILIGPEGGFEPNEITAARKQGFQALGLGPRILRAETAALAACAIAQGIFGDMSEGWPAAKNVLDNPDPV